MRYVLASSSCDALSASQFSVIIQKYSTGQRFGHITIFYVFKHCISFAHQAFIYLIKNTEKNSKIVQYCWYYNLK